MNGQTHRKRSGTTGAGTSARRLLPPIFVLLLLLSTAIPTARIVVARLKQLAQDARSASFVARVTDEVVNTEDLDLAVGANPRLSRNEALSQILEQKILVEIGRQGGFDVRASLPAYAQQHAEEIERAKTLWKLTPEEIQQNLERNLLAERGLEALAASARTTDEELSEYYVQHRGQYQAPLEQVRAQVEVEVVAEKVRGELDYLHFMSVRELRSGYEDVHIPPDEQPLNPGSELRLSMVILLAGGILVGALEWMLARQG